LALQFGVSLEEAAEAASKLAVEPGFQRRPDKCEMCKRTVNITSLASGMRRVKSRARGRAMAQDVSEIILAKISAGALPRPVDGSRKSYVGKGTNRTCDGCDQPITQEDVEHEVDVADNCTLRFHQECFIVWQAAVNT